MKTLCKGFIPLVCILLLAGCNNDIFIDDEPSVSESRLDIGADGEASFTFPTKNLVSVNVIFDAGFNCVKYLASGEEFARYKSVTNMTLFDVTSSQPFISRLTAENSEAALEITGSSDGRITLRSVENFRGEPVSGSFIIDYVYYKETVAFEIASSLTEKPVLVAKKFVYRDDDISYVGREKSLTFAMENRLPDPGKQYLTPSKYCPMFVCFQKTTILDNKIDYGNLTVNIPTWDADKKKPEFLGEKATLAIGTESRAPLDYVLPEGDSFSKEIEFVVPSMMKGTLKLKFVEVFMTAYATLFVVNPNTGREYEIEIRIDVMQPVSYSYTEETSPLS